MKRLGLQTLTVVFVILFSSAASAEKAAVSYFSANILYCDITNGEERDRYVQRREDLVRLLAKLRPDVIGIQEASVCKIYGHSSGDDTVAEISSGLKKRGLDYGAYFWQSENIGSVWLEGLAFMWNRETVDLQEKLIECRHLKDSYLHRGALIRKSLCRAEVATAGGANDEQNVGLLIYNTHLDARNNDIKRKQAMEIRDTLKKEVVAGGRPALFGGDLNSREMEEIFESAGFGLLQLDRVDYLFSSGIPESDIETEVIPLHSVEGVPDISDHNGIFATVTFKK